MQSSVLPLILIICVLLVQPSHTEANLAEGVYTRFTEFEPDRDIVLYTADDSSNGTMTIVLDIQGEIWNHQRENLTLSLECGQEIQVSLLEGEITEYPTRISRRIALAKGHCDLEERVESYSLATDETASFRAITGIEVDNYYKKVLPTGTYSLYFSPESFVNKSDVNMNFMSFTLQIVVSEVDGRTSVESKMSVPPGWGEELGDPNEYEFTDLLTASLLLTPILTSMIILVGRSRLMRRGVFKS